MKRFLPLFPLVFVLFLVLPMPAQAADTDESSSNVSITVVMPDAVPEAEQAPFRALPSIPELNSASMPAPAIPALYPSGVYETLENGVRWIVKTYELGAGENPENIPRDSFERDGWTYSLTEIIKKETAAADVREHTETVEVNTDTKDMEAILRQFAPAIDFTSEGGYTGILALDVASITVETAGTKNIGYTVNVKREYPHLSSNDTSLV
ncbi:MAG: hypothetical protein LBK91_02840, partial [Synergistaceae bacterium]|nr:hypothetical protein [Synergistaceae bacterium]